jgi:predicted glycogen debranching enzyme
MEPLSQQILQDWEQISRREWLVTNGIGGYASSSISGANTRRYHGLLVAACEPPLGRAVVFSKLEEELRVEDHLYLLSANQYPSVNYPQGFRHLQSFTLDPVPTFTYSVHENTVVLQKQIWMAYGENSTYITYTLLKAPEPVKLGLIPFLVYKDYHTEQHRWDGFKADYTTTSAGSLRFVDFDGAHPTYMRLTPSNSFQFHAISGWFYNYEHARELERGLDHLEDLYCPGRYDGMLAPGKSVTFVVSLDEENLAEPSISHAKEISRQGRLLSLAAEESTTESDLRRLVIAADQFVIEKSDTVARATIIAGYPWFTDWGRDTMISLPGLTLCTGRHDVAKSILLAFTGAIQDGLLPNRFTDGNAGADFNTVDATLWYFHAAHQYAIHSGDWALLTVDLLPHFEDILNAHIAGTKYGIRADPDDGLLFAGEPGVQLTWMDAKVGDWVVTPRIGKPVEIQALWFNALSVAAEVAGRSGKNGAIWKSMAEKAQKSFTSKFVNPESGSLYDVIEGPNGAPPDSAIRPNQIFALSLPFSLIDPGTTTAKAVLKVVTDNLLTPYGLRTLAPTDPAYVGTYAPGDQTRRDGAYHQGTVWPWLLGAYIDAHRKVERDSAQVRVILKDILESMNNYGVGSIAEIFDGNAPHNPNGCIAQAWSVAEVLRSLKALQTS